MIAVFPAAAVPKEASALPSHLLATTTSRFHCGNLETEATRYCGARQPCSQSQSQSHTLSLGVDARAECLPQARQGWGRPPSVATSECVTSRPPKIEAPPGAVCRLRGPMPVSHRGRRSEGGESVILCVFAFTIHASPPSPPPKSTHPLFSPHQTALPHPRQPPTPPSLRKKTEEAANKKKAQTPPNQNPRGARGGRLHDAPSPHSTWSWTSRWSLTAPFSS
ncbi:hypothetical protein QBC39DRAFT_124914 [Podospora conica]|nr:hypothetical protein QBC39DRAFT_124914 [Schizothecium conicum]